MQRLLISTILMLILASGSARAESISGKFGLTGKAGVLVPLKDRFISSSAITGKAEGQADFAGGGGFIYGIGENLALEMEALRVPNLDVEIAGSKVYEASLTDLSLGLQYRFTPNNRLVPLVGGGVDFIKGELEATTGAGYSMEWTVGGHAHAGVDYFFTPGIALAAELRGIYTARGDINAGDVKVGKYDPLSFVGTLGVRLFLPKSAFR